jgi:ketosteroid isomerase-like protein
MFRESLLAATALTVTFFGLRTISYTQPNDEMQIRALEHRFADAFKAKNADEIIANYAHSPNLVFFDVVPRREYTGWDAYKKDWEGLFASLDSVALFEIKDLAVNVDSNLAYGHSFQHHIYTFQKTGVVNNATVRVTDVYRKSRGRWLIVQEHVSVPVNLQTGKVDAQFTP